MTSSLAESSKLAQSSLVVAGGPDRIVVSGGVPSIPTLKVRLCGGCSTFSAGSMARTRNTWLPGVRSLYSIGDSHCSNGSASIWHSNVEPGSFAEKVKIASKTPSIVLVWAVCSVVTGGVWSSTIVQRQLAGVASTFRAPSTERTRRRCSPGVRPVYWIGSGQVVKDAPSSAHWKVTIASLLSTAKVAIGPAPSGSEV